MPKLRLCRKSFAALLQYLDRFHRSSFATELQDSTNFVGQVLVFEEEDNIRMSLDTLFESNLLNLAVVWVCLFVILKTPFTEAITSYLDSQRQTRETLETAFLSSKQNAHRVQTLARQSTEFSNFVQRSQGTSDTSFLVDHPSFRTSLSLSAVGRPESFRTKMSGLFSTVCTPPKF